MIDWLSKVLRPTQHKIGNLGDVPQTNLLSWYGKTKPDTTKACIHKSQEMYYNTCSVLGVGRRTVWHGLGERRGGAAAGVPVRPWRRQQVSPLPPMVRRRPIRLLDDVAATKRRTTSSLTLCGAQLDTSGCFPHPSNYFWLINSTSGLGTAPETEPCQCPLTRYSDSDISPSSSRTFLAYRTFRVQNGG